MRPQPLPEAGAAGLAALDHVVPVGAQPRGQPAGLRRLADPVEALEGHEHRWSLGAPADGGGRYDGSATGLTRNAGSPSMLATLFSAW